MIPCRGDAKNKITGLILLVAVPSFIGNTATRLIALALCLNVAIFLTVQWSRRFQRESAAKAASEKARHADLITSEIKPVRNHLASDVQMALVFMNQLKEVTRETEQAAVEMGDKFMGIASRARKHAEMVWSSFEGIECLAQQMDGCAQNAAPAKLDDLMNLTKGRLDELKTETEALGRDINSIIVAMQYQDITRQRVERVILQLAQFRQESEQLLQNLRGMGAAERQNGDGQFERMYTLASGRAVTKDSLLALNRTIT